MINRDDVIRIARETYGPHKFSNAGINYLQRFAALVAAAEREACAKVCDDLWKDNYTAYACAEAIRARGKA